MIERPVAPHPQGQACWRTVAPSVSRASPPVASAPYGWQGSLPLRKGVAGRGPHEGRSGRGPASRKPAASVASSARAGSASPAWGQELVRTRRPRGPRGGGAAGRHRWAAPRSSQSSCGKRERRGWRETTATAAHSRDRAQLAHLAHLADPTHVRNQRAYFSPKSNFPEPRTKSKLRTHARFVRTYPNG